MKYLSQRLLFYHLNFDVLHIENFVTHVCLFGIGIVHECALFVEFVIVIIEDVCDIEYVC